MGVERAVVTAFVPEQTVIAIGPSTASTMSARLIFVAGRASAKPAAGAANAGEQARAGQWPISFCAVGSGTPVSSASSVARQPRAAPRRAAAVISTTA